MLGHSGGQVLPLVCWIAGVEPYILLVSAHRMPSVADGETSAANGHTDLAAIAGHQCLGCMSVGEN